MSKADSKIMANVAANSEHSLRLNMQLLLRVHLYTKTIVLKMLKHTVSLNSHASRIMRISTIFSLVIAL